MAMVMTVRVRRGRPQLFGDLSKLWYARPLRDPVDDRLNGYKGLGRTWANALNDLLDKVGRSGVRVDTYKVYLVLGGGGESDGRAEPGQH